jgi:hypothetical protein
MDDERDLAHEADMERLRREQLRADISPEEAAEECAEIEAREAYLDDYDDLMGDPDEYDMDVCSHCHDDGRDPDCDYLLPCPVCQGEQPAGPLAALSRSEQSK